MSLYKITLYNGATGAVYYATGGTPTLSGTVPSQGSGYGAVAFAVAGIQNGNPDGISLSLAADGTLLDFYSYGGTFTASE